MTIDCTQARPPGFEAAAQRGEVRRPVVLTDGFDHLDRGDRVVAAVFVAIVPAQQPHTRPLRGEARLRVVELCGREREAGHAVTGARRGFRKAAPAAADLEDRARRLELQFGQHPRVLGMLAGDERCASGVAPAASTAGETARSNSSSSDRARARRRRCRGRSARGCCAAPARACCASAGGAGGAAGCPRPSRRSRPRPRGDCARRSAAGAAGRGVLHPPAT